MLLSKTQGLIVFCQVFTVISVVYLVVGLIKPKWVWLGEKAPNRQLVIGIALVMFMASVTGGTELSVRLKKEQAEEKRMAALAAEAQSGQAAAPAAAPATPAPQTPAVQAPAPAAAKSAPAPVAASAAPAPAAAKAPAKHAAEKTKADNKKKAPAKAD